MDGGSLFLDEQISFLAKDENKVNAKNQKSPKIKLSSQITNNSDSVIIRATSRKITDIDLVPSYYQSSTSVYLSYNFISSLKNIIQFHHLSKLMIEYNRIKYIEDLEPLAYLQYLLELKLEGNPVCRIPLWDLHTINLCEKLYLLNGKIVKRVDYSKIISNEKQLLHSIFFVHVATNIAKKLSKLDLHSVDDKKRAEIIRNELKSNNKEVFFNKIRSSSPSAEYEPYINHLRKSAIKIHNEFLSNFPNFLEVFKNDLDNDGNDETELHDTSLLSKTSQIDNQSKEENHQKLNSNFNKLLKRLQNVSEISPFSNTFNTLSDLLACFGLQAVGLNSNENITKILECNQEENQNIPDAIEYSLLVDGYQDDDTIVEQFKCNVEVESSIEEFHANGYNPDLQIYVTSNNVFEIPDNEMQKNENPSNDIPDDACSQHSKSLTFEKQLENEILESEILSQHVEEEDNSSDSGDSFTQQQKIINATPITKTIPLSEASANDFHLLPNKELSIPKLQKHKNTSSSKSVKSHMNNDLRKIFRKREYQELMGGTIGEMLSNESVAFDSYSQKSRNTSIS